MFGRAKIESYENVIGHLEKHIKRLEQMNEQLLNRIMAKNFQEYQIMKEPEKEESSLHNFVIPVPGTIDTYEAEAHEIG